MFNCLIWICQYLFMFLMLLHLNTVLQIFNFMKKFEQNWFLSAIEIFNIFVLSICLKIFDNCAPGI